MSVSPADVTEESVLLVPRDVFEPKHEEYQVRTFIRTELAPQLRKWEQRGRVEPEAYRKASQAGLYCTMCIPKEYGGQLDGAQADFRYNVVVAEELEYADCGSIFFPLGSDIVLPYFTHIATAEQKKRWLPRIAKENLILAVAMSEPEIGSDLQGVSTTARKVLGPDGKTPQWLINGRKMWISNGAIADLIVVVALTSPPDAPRKAFSLFVVEKGTPGYEVRKVVQKVGRPAQDTAVLSFRDVRVPAENLLGEEGKGFKHLMHNLPQERLSIGVAAVAAARRILALTVRYVHGRALFNRTVGDFQHVAFKLVDVMTEINLCQTLTDRAVRLLVEQRCSTELASMVKAYATELYCRTADTCLQFYGGYGYLKSSPVGRAFVDSRVTSIYGGANEIMREIIGKKLGFVRAPPPKASKPTAPATLPASIGSSSGGGSDSNSGGGKGDYEVTAKAQL